MELNQKGGGECSYLTIYRLSFLGMEEKKWCVYKHTNKINNKVYIGITGEKNVNKRWKNGNGYNNNIYFRNSIKKYGWGNFSHEILFDCLLKNEAESIEVQLIKHYISNNRNFGYNIASGGAVNCGYTMSSDSKLKMSIARKGKYTLGDHPQAKRVLFDGKVFASKEDLAIHLNMPSSTLGGILTGRYSMPIELYDCGLRYEDVGIEQYTVRDDNVAKLKSMKISQSRSGKNNGLIGKNHPNFGKTLSQQQKQLISEKNIGGNNPRAKKVICEGIMFNCAKDVAKYYNINYGTMRSWLNKSNRMPEEWFKRGLRYHNICITTYQKELKARCIVCDNKMFENVNDCSKYLEKAISTIGNYLSGSRKMPQKYIDLGLRYATQEEIDEYIEHKSN